MNTLEYLKLMKVNEQVIIFSSGNIQSINFKIDRQRIVYNGEVQYIPLEILNKTKVVKEYYNEAFNCKVLRVEKDKFNNFD